MYEIKKGAPPPSETKYPWDQMEVTDHFDCDFCELNTLMRSVKKMQKKRHGFSVEIARYGDMLMVWLVSKGKESKSASKIDDRIIKMLQESKGWISEGIFYNRIKWAAPEDIKNCLNFLVYKNVILQDEKIHPKKKTIANMYCIA